MVILFNIYYFPNQQETHVYLYKCLLFLFPSLLEENRAFYNKSTPLVSFFGHSGCISPWLKPEVLYKCTCIVFYINGFYVCFTIGYLFSFQMWNQKTSTWVCYPRKLWIPSRQTVSGAPPNSWTGFRIITPSLSQASRWRSMLWRNSSKGLMVSNGGRELYTVAGNLVK